MCAHQMNLFVEWLKSWYFVVLVLGVVFLILTRKAWNKIVSELVIQIKTRIANISNSQKSSTMKTPSVSKKVRDVLKKAGIKSVDNLGSYVEALNISNQEHTTTIARQTDVINQLIQLGVYYKNSFLGLHLVPLTKLILLWIYNQQPITRTRYNLEYIIPRSVPNPDLERVVIFDTLIDHSLLTLQNDGTYIVSEDGKSFLISQGLLPQST